jgi:hypothetical protein
MVVTFPLSMPTPVRVRSARFRLDCLEEQSPTRGGKIISVERAEPLWALDIATASLTPSQRGEWLAWFGLLRSVNPFWGYDPDWRWPLAYRNGFGGLTRADGSAFDGTCRIQGVGSNTSEITLYDMPAGYVMSQGDYLAFSYGTSARALHQVSVGGTASELGVLGVVVTPFLRDGWAPNAVVNLVKASAKMLIVPKSIDRGEPDASGLAAVSFKAIQTLG